MSGEVWKEVETEVGKVRIAKAKEKKKKREEEGKKQKRERIMDIKKITEE